MHFSEIVWLCIVLNHSDSEKIHTEKYFTVFKSRSNPEIFCGLCRYNSNCWCFMVSYIDDIK